MYTKVHIKGCLTGKECRLVMKQLLWRATARSDVPKFLACFKIVIQIQKAIITNAGLRFPASSTMRQCLTSTWASPAQRLETGNFYR